MSDEKMHLVVEILGEGGSLTLFASTSGKPNYVLAIVDQSLAFIGEGEEIKGERGRAKTWRGALKLLDNYPWHKLYPEQVAPEYRKRILAAALRRLEKESASYAKNRVTSWREVCASSENPFDSRSVSRGCPE